MYEWLERQIELIGDSAHEYSETPDVQRLIAMGQMLEVQVMLESEMIKDYLNASQRNTLLIYLKTVETLVF